MPLPRGDARLKVYASNDFLIRVSKFLKSKSKSELRGKKLEGRDEGEKMMALELLERRDEGDDRESRICYFCSINEFRVL